MNCDLAFECPKDWFQLTPTQNSDIKYCNFCKKQVFLCLDENELNLRSREGACIAYFIDPDRKTRFQLSREKVNAQKLRKNNPPRMMMGLPRSTSTHSLATLESFLESKKSESSD